MVVLFECKSMSIQPTYSKPIHANKASIFGNFRVTISIQINERPHLASFFLASSTCQDSYRHFKIRWEDWGRPYEPHHYISFVVCIQFIFA